VAATFERHDLSVGGLVTNVEFVGNIEEILELDYQNHCVVVLLYKWVKAKYSDSCPTIIQDDLGFTIANFESMVDLGKESFAFLIHCQQVFFSDDPNRPRWKVVCRTDVCGRCGDLYYTWLEIDMLAVGLDANYSGLQPGVERRTGIGHPRLQVHKDPSVGAT
jgi:hypothetical protein